MNYEFVSRIKNQFPNITFVINGGINSLSKALELSKIHDGVMLGRLIQNNPFCLKDVDQLFYEKKNKYKISESTVVEYFNFIKPLRGSESIYRLLSPLLNIFFGIPDGKHFKIEIHSKMQDQNFHALEKIFLDFIKQKKLLIN